MRLVGYAKATGFGIGVLHDDRLIDVSKAVPDAPTLWHTLMSPDAFERLSKSVEQAGREDAVDEGWRYRPFLVRPPKILCIGLNYLDHARETGLPIPDYPIVFARYPSSVVGHKEPLRLPRESDNFDYEGELAVVIGRQGRSIGEGDALSYVAGYSVFNEGSIRDYQFRSSQWTMGKNFDCTGAMGPALVTRDEVAQGPGNLRIKTELNGQVVQDSSTSEMIFGVERLIADLSEVMTLEAGDVIVTGTPPGVGIGRKPPLFMKSGDTCTVEIERVGLLSNTVQSVT